MFPNSKIVRSRVTAKPDPGRSDGADSDLRAGRAVLTELLTDPDREKSQRVTGAMVKTKRIEIGELERAAAQT